MTRTKTLPRRALAVWLSGALTLSTGAFALTGGPQDPQIAPEQGQEKPEEDKLDLGQFNPFSKQQPADPQQEMIRLFQEVEGRMNKMGELLFDASKGDTDALSDLGPSGIDDIPKNAQDQPQGGGGALADLLKSTTAEGASVLEGIDKILEIAKNQGGGT